MFEILQEIATCLGCYVFCFIAQSAQQDIYGDNTIVW